MDFILRRAILASAGRETRPDSVTVADGLFAPNNTASPKTAAVDLAGRSVVYPGLINTHDHLMGNYRPPVGPPPGRFYRTWRPWDDALKASDTFRERSQLSREDLYALSGYKCLFSGVTTVSDHFPHELNADLLPDLPVRALTGYTLSHEATSGDLNWGDGVETEHRRAVEREWPFITHLAEGFSDECMDAAGALDHLGVLDRHCLLVHCLALSDADIGRVARAGASVAWCGRSNTRMFNVTCKIRKLLTAGVNVTVGTDSSASGSANLLAEMRYDRDLYRRLYGEDLPARTLFDMVTVNAARAFLMAGRVGVIAPGAMADLLVIRARLDDPFENLLAASMDDIEFVAVAGKPVYGDERFRPCLDGADGGQADGLSAGGPSAGLPREYSWLRVGGRRMFVIGDPAGLYTRCRARVGVNRILDYLPFEPGEAA